MKYENIIFDLDGTLSNSEISITTTLKQTFEHLGAKTPPYETLLKFIGPPLVESFMKYCGFDKTAAINARCIYQSYFDVTGKELNVLYDGIEDLLINLKNQGKHLYIATTKEEKASEYIVGKLGIAKYFDKLVGASKDNSLSEKCDLLKKLFAISGISPDSAVLIGDTTYDVIGARKAGIDCIAVLYGYNTAEQLLNGGANILVKDVKTLHKLFA